MSKKINLAGIRFGKLLVVRESAPYISPKGAKVVKWECLCDCGNTKNIVSPSLKNGDSNSCGCLFTEVMKKHGDTGTRLHSIWAGMKSRCQVNPMYAKISVCPEWKNSYTPFKNWALANGYTDELSIDRKDNDGNYEPDNCRWTIQLVQSANTRILYSHNKSGYRGVSWNTGYGKWEVSISVNQKTIKVGYYDLVLDAAKAYDTYVRDNDLHHTTNNTVGRVEPSAGKTLSAVNTSGYVGVTSPKRVRNMKNPWVASVMVKKKSVFNGYFKTSLEAAKAREAYIVENNLPHKRNFSV